MSLSTHYPNTDHIFDLLITVARLVERVSHQPGRIELRIGFFDLPKLASVMHGLNVTDEAQSIPGILGYKVHALSTSATIAYDPEIIPFDFWEAFCRVKGEPPAENAFRGHFEQLIQGYKTGSGAQESET